MYTLSNQKPDVCIVEKWMVGRPGNKANCPHGLARTITYMST